MSLLEAVGRFIEYEEHGSKENWCEWDQHFQDLKKAYQDHVAFKLMKNLKDFKEEK